MLLISLLLSFILASPEKKASVTVAPGEPEYVYLAAQDLVSDVKSITGVELELRRGKKVRKGGVFIGTSPGDGRWEAYEVSVSDGILQMKTDNKDLFEDSVMYFLHSGFMPEEFSVDYRRNEHPEDAVTEYERRFLDLGQPIYRICVRPCRSSGDMLK